MTKPNLIQLALALIVCLLAAMPSPAAQELRIAVAANFTPAAKELAKAFEAKTGTRVRLSFGSTGKIYTQIINGAPYDLFFAADAVRPEKLDAEGRVLEGGRITYATGTLVLWSPNPDLITDDLAALTSGQFKRIAIANPKTAPYGQAALDVLDGLGLTEAIRTKLVRGNNIAQTFQFVVSGNAELGFVAASQAGQMPEGSRWTIPGDRHGSLEQQAVALSSARDPDLALAFLSFIQAPDSQAIIKRYGYRVGD